MGEAVSQSPDEEEVMIPGEMSALPSPPPPDGPLISALLEGATLTRASYNAISSLTSSLFCLPTGAQEYVGHTLHPLTLYWRCSSIESIVPSTGIYSELAQEGVRMIKVGMTEYVVPLTNVSGLVCVI